MGNCQGMPDSTFAALWSAALSVPDRDVFLSDPAFSAVPLDERGSGDEHGNKQYRSFCTREQMVVFLKRVKEM